MKPVVGVLIVCLATLSASHGALADAETLDLMKRLSGTSELPAALSSAMPPGVQVMSRQFGDIQGTSDFSGAQIEMMLAPPDDLDHSMLTTGQLILPSKISVTDFLSQAIGSDYDGSVSCGSGQAYITVGDDGTTVSIAALAHGKALIVQTSESYHRPLNQRYGEAVLRGVALATCRMYAGQDVAVFTPPDPTTPPAKPEQYDPWDFSSITIDMAEPDKLVESELASGQPYQISVPAGGRLDVFDRPNGNLIAGVYRDSEVRAEVRAKYYYTANLNEIWVGVCTGLSPCGWVEADYLLSLPPGIPGYDVFRVTVYELQAYEQPDSNSREVGRLFRDNLVAVIGQQSGASGYWFNICRLHSCGGWVLSDGLTFEYGM